jgi:hypothetical protein
MCNFLWDTIGLFEPYLKGATTLSIMTLSITTLSIKIFYVTLSMRHSA